MATAQAHPPEHAMDHAMTPQSACLEPSHKAHNGTTQRTEPIMQWSRSGEPMSTYTSAQNLANADNMIKHGVSNLENTSEEPRRDSIKLTVEGE